MKTKVEKLILLSILLISISGCGTSFFSTRQTNPLMTDYMGVWPFPGSVATISPDASRRITIIRLTEAGENYSPERWRSGEFCAEPPPDAMVDTASLFAAALAGKLKVPGPQGASSAMAEGEVQTQFIQQIASAMSPLLRRSQGLQWARDNLSFVCNAHLNRVITREQYLGLVKWILESSGMLIGAEMNTLPGTTLRGDETKPTPPTLPELPTIPNLAPKLLTNQP